MGEILQGNFENLLEEFLKHLWKETVIIPFFYSGSTFVLELGLGLGTWSIGIEPAISELSGAISKKKTFWKNSWKNLLRNTWIKAWRIYRTLAGATFWSYFGKFQKKLSDGNFWKNRCLDPWEMWNVWISLRRITVDILERIC